MNLIHREIKTMSEQEQNIYQKAHTCKYCTDTFDNKGEYISTYCHKFHKHVLGFTNGGLMLCGTCMEPNKKEITK